MGEYSDACKGKYRFGACFSINGALSHSMVVLDCHGLSSIIAIHKDILVFTFSFNLNLSIKEIKVKNM